MIGAWRRIPFETAGAKPDEVLGADSVRDPVPRSLSGYNYLEGRMRRGCDVSFAVLLLLITAPLFAVIAAAVWLSSSGPVLFRQRRHGRAMREFELLKFRTMYWSGEPDRDVKQATEADPRITPIGRILRPTSLDELPQLINVLRGEMSLIGPRPHAIEHDLFYGDHISNYRLRFIARPGLTGLAQVSGARGQTPEIDDMARRLAFDLEYLDRASPRLDATILLLTIYEVFRSRSAG
jgi:lipopolysaccharide/colanic/teichoic acid biosynthesis glycosyltransferase